MENPALVKRQKAATFGKQAEQIASDYLLSLGYTIRERNWKGSGKFEVDIIAQYHQDIVFIEVKARTDENINPVDAIDNRKMKQMVRAADSYLSRFDTPFYYRFDIIAISGTLNDPKLVHYPNAFLSPLSTR